MKQPTATTLLLLCLASSLGAQTEPAAPAAKIDLRIQCKPGSSVWLSQQVSSERKMEMMGQPMDSGSTTTYIVQCTVKEVDAKGQLVVEAKIGRVSGTMSMPQLGDTSFDSADAATADKATEDDGSGMPDLSAAGQALAGLAGKTFTAHIDANGEVTSTDGVEPILAEARKRAGMTGQMIADQLQEPMFERLVRSAFGVRPKEAISVGGSWETDEVGKRSPVVNKTKLTLKSIDDTQFVLAVTGTVEKSAAPAAPVAGEGPEAEQARQAFEKSKIKNGKIVAAATISRTDGFLVESSSEMTMDLTVVSPFGELDIAQKSTTKTKRVTAEAAQKAPTAKEPPKEPAKTADK